MLGMLLSGAILIDWLFESSCAAGYFRTAPDPSSRRTSFPAGSAPIDSRTNEEGRDAPQNIAACGSILKMGLLLGHPLVI